jgi:hypothetical protein
MKLVKKLALTSAHSGLAIKDPEIIKGAAMPPQIPEKPSLNTSASTKALLVQHSYPAWLACRA